jgi:hypothetical protein
MPKTKTDGLVLHSTVFVDVYDLTKQAHDGLTAGYYYSIPHDPETGEVLDDNDSYLVGPYDTGEDARSAGVKFIEDSLHDTNKVVQLAETEH